MARPNNSAAAYQAVRRWRMEMRITAPRCAGSSPRRARCAARGFARRLDLAAEQPDKSVERIALDFGIASPDAFDQRFAGQYAVRVAHQQFQDGVFGSGEFDLAGAAPHFARSQVNRETGGFQHDGLSDRTAAPNGPHAGQKDFEGEWLGEIVVGADIEALHDVAGGIPRGQHQDGRAIAVGAKLARDFETTHAGQHAHRESAGRIRRPRRTPTLAAIDRDGHGVAVFHQSLPEQFRHPAFVLDYQNPHRPTETPW